MLTLQSIEGIDETALELLEAAGWTDPRKLALADAAVVAAEMARANGILRLVRQVPGRQAVAGWIEASRELTGIHPEHEGMVSLRERVVPDEVEPPEVFAEDVLVLARESGEGADEAARVVDFEADPDIRAMIDVAPVAIPVPNQLLAERGIAPGEIAVAAVLSHAAEDIEIRTGERARRRSAATAELLGGSPKAGVKVVKVAESSVEDRRGIDSGRVRSIEEAQAEPAPKRRVNTDERLNLLRAAREATNAGKSPNSRFYIRGVLHDRPYLVWFGCLIVLLIQALVPLAVVAAALLILSDMVPIRFGWVPSWFLAIPASLPLLGILYMMLCLKVKCRVCGQKLLAPRSCLKNRKAHHVPGLGYVMPLALHTVVFRWFNCTFCGTSIRIKE